MKIFVIGSDVPYRQHNQEGVSAINIQLYEFIRALACLEHEVALQLILNVFREHHFNTNSLMPSDMNELYHLEQLGFLVLPPIYPEQYLPKQDLKTSHALVRASRRVVQLLSKQVRLQDFYPAVNVREIVCERVYSSGSDVILTVASPEGVAATHGFRELPKIAYQGDIHFRAAEVRMKDCALWSDQGSLRDGGIVLRELRRLYSRLWLAGFKQAHLRLMLDVDVIVEATASNVDFYREHGHPKALYVGTTWKDLGVGHADFTRGGSQVNSSDRTIKIIGPVGFLNSTGRTYALKFLLVDLAPILRQVMDGLDYQIHVIGSGEVVPSLRPWLGQEHIVMRSYVEDLDSELRTSDVFLLLENAGPHVVTYSRHIVAWSMGLCLIVHANSKKAIPEIKHMENALLGSTPEEIAQMIYLAATDIDLNRRVRQGGRSTYERYFSPMVLATKLSSEMESLLTKS